MTVGTGYVSKVFSLLVGDPFGAVKPIPPELPLVAVPGRVHALNILRDYIAELTFARPTAPGNSQRFRIAKEEIFIEQPKVSDLRFPSIVFRPGDGVYEPIGLSTYIDEATRDRFGKGTVVQEQSEWTETITIECWAEEGPQRAAMVAGLETAITPTEQRAALMFRMPDYYDRTVRFFIDRGSFPDDPDAIRGRRWAHLQLGMRFVVVALVNYVEMRPEVETTVVDPGFESLEVIPVDVPPAPAAPVLPDPVGAAPAGAGPWGG